MQTVTTAAALDDNDDNNNNPFKKRITYDDSKAINKYLDQMENMRKNTYIGARTKLSLLPEFAKKTYGLTVDDLIREMMKKKAKEEDEEEDNSSSSTERSLCSPRMPLFLEKRKARLLPMRRASELPVRASSLSSIQWSFHSERQFRLKVKLERPIKIGPRQLQTRKRLSRSCRPRRSLF
jgi:hypothetical protein